MRLLRLGTGGDCHSAYVSQGGVALAIVVWFIAGMSLLVVGIVSNARVDTRMAQLHVAGAKAAAAGDGAIHLMMASLVANRLEIPAAGQPPRADFLLGDLDVGVVMLPTNNLVDINTASSRLLEILFARLGDLEPAAAKAAADNVIKWRSPQSKGGGAKRARRFTALEDLLRVEGVNRALFDGVRDYIMVGDNARGGANFSVVPEALMGVLQEADSGRASSLERQRNRPPGNNPEGTLSAASGGTFRMDAVVRYGDDLWLRRRWVKMESQSGSSLPWSTVRTEPPRVIGKAI